MLGALCVFYNAQNNKIGIMVTIIALLPFTFRDGSTFFIIFELILSVLNFLKV